MSLEFASMADSHAGFLRGVRVPRLNFAQVCMWCGQRWCQSAACITGHESYSWAVCQRCEGRDGGGCGDRFHGVAPETSAVVAAQVNAKYVIAVVDYTGEQACRTSGETLHCSHLTLY
jgi:hypothetical protein